MHPKPKPGHLRAICLSINRPARSISYACWSRGLDRFLKNDAGQGGQLILEDPESSAMQVPERWIDFIDHRQARSFALDEFGARSLSCRHFRKFLFDVARIDGQFVRGNAFARDNQTPARVLIAMAPGFEMLSPPNQPNLLKTRHFWSPMASTARRVFCLALPRALPWIPKIPQKQVVDRNSVRETAPGCSPRQAVRCCKCSVPVCRSILKQGTMRHSFVRGFSQSPPTSLQDHDGKGLTV